MRTIAHLSDLHFGAEDPALAEALLADLAAAAPSVVAVSGDLTQRARESQFAAARAFLARLPAPRVVVPGNHDIPLFDVVRRFLAPLARYHRYIDPEADPFFHDEEIALQGINTARANTWKDGRISERQILGLRARLCALPHGLFKVMVSHHPLAPPPRDPAPPAVGRSLRALRAAAECGVELLLAGHLHEGYTADVRATHVGLQRSMIVAQAGTALSRRRRGEPNAYNVVTVDPPRLRVQVRAWTGQGFAPVSATEYRKEGLEWRRQG
ncbi:MAG TPA: metallophosphoesterase [Vicinamibacteria bacterium]|nr:metallophosphoesterase [Vicinamibacteria bacterium]